MKSSVEKLSDTRVKLTVEVPVEDLKTEIDQAYAGLAQQVNIPGFRRGKAPRQLIEARFGRNVVMEQVVNDGLGARYEEALREAEVIPLGQPAIEITEVDADKGFDFTAEVDIRPEITLPDFATFNIEVPALKTDDEAVDAEIDKLRERFAELKDTKRKLKTDDFAIIDVVASVDGEEIEDSKAEGLSYRVGAGDLIDGLDTALRGLKTGESAEFTTTLKNGEHEGKEATVKVSVQQTKERKLPELDEEFVQTASEFDTVEELRESYKEQVEENAKSRQAAAIRDEVLKAALEASEFPIPEAFVSEQAHNQLHQIFGELAHDDAALNAALEAQGTTRKEFEEEVHKSSEQAVRTQLFLDVLAEQEEPEVSQQELTDHILFTAQSYGMDPNQFVMQLQQSGQIANLFGDVRRGKALAAAIVRVNVKDEDGNVVDPNEYFGIEEEEETTSEQ
ncbi:trigger factor Tig [Corynebacterium kutscheri]|uniref:Trigger factor n=1 Tax=Corynebacterium kutscheri TaxID=35755 RepID=A0A0F6TDH1_9CORY|nr:trigger factor [Corynebacterium kutscheri]AKE40886.1 trigger factor [Corynebacterium kutscheri]VEH06655.1 trigger factor Tig [Corynebacterium kutscheri]VEH09183.1 trigger factor Tig [Corynebacterium kutscheri]VEH82587.1 trigger factor Tig [Corynebacterium kutscheri]